MDKLSGNLFTSKLYIMNTQSDAITITINGIFDIFFYLFSIKFNMYSFISINSLSMCFRNATCFFAHSAGLVGRDVIHSSNGIVFWF